jgi:UPF0716 family protein affecting phage T7 exclusion
MTILLILIFLSLFWIHINSFWVPGGRYRGFPSPVAVVSVIQTIILGIIFIKSNGAQKGQRNQRDQKEDQTHQYSA